MADSSTTRLAPRLRPGDGRMPMRDGLLPCAQKMISSIHLLDLVPFRAILSGDQGSGKSLVCRVALQAFLHFAQKRTIFTVNKPGGKQVFTACSHVYLPNSQCILPGCTQSFEECGTSLACTWATAH